MFKHWNHVTYADPPEFNQFEPFCVFRISHFARMKFNLQDKHGEHSTQKSLIFAEWVLQIILFSMLRTVNEWKHTWAWEYEGEWDTDCCALLWFHDIVGGFSFLFFHRLRLLYDKHSMLDRMWRNWMVYFHFQGEKHFFPIFLFSILLKEEINLESEFPCFFARFLL